MGRDYEHLNAVEREEIFLLLNEGKKQYEIAKVLGRNKATISRELRRGGRISRRKGLQYFAYEAIKRALQRKKNSRKIPYVGKDGRLRRYIENRIHAGWSPEQIAGRLKQEQNGSYLNHESIYSYLYSKEGVQKRLGWSLRKPRLFRCPKQGRRPRKTPILDRVDIALRPPEVLERQQFGHWEGDTMFFMGHKQGLATHVERKSRYIMVRRSGNKKAAARAQLINGLFGRLPNGSMKTFTFDNGTEFAAHKKISESLGADIYFTKPYAAWQKGSIENANGLIRWFFPRMTDINKLEDWKLNGVITLINNRPKKCLNYQTPAEVFEQELKNLPQKVALPS